jgi:hypothetical protein
VHKQLPPKHVIRSWTSCRRARDAQDEDIGIADAEALRLPEDLGGRNHRCTFIIRSMRGISFRGRSTKCWKAERLAKSARIARDFAGYQRLWRT